MNVWVYIALFAIGATALILGLATAFSFAVTALAHRHAAKTMDKHIAKLENLLPGKNCGACGCETCEEYARGIFSCRMETDLCTQSDAALQERLNACMDEFQQILDGKRPGRFTH